MVSVSAVCVGVCTLTKVPRIAPPASSKVPRVRTERAAVTADEEEVVR